jgi:hypothetical protein
MTHFLLGLLAGAALCSLVFVGYLVYHLYKLFKYGA